MPGTTTTRRALRAKRAALVATRHSYRLTHFIVLVCCWALTIFWFLFFLLFGDADKISPPPAAHSAHSDHNLKTLYPGKNKRIGSHLKKGRRRKMISFFFSEFSPYFSISIKVSAETFIKNTPHHSALAPYMPTRQQPKRRLLFR